MRCKSRFADRLGYLSFGPCIESSPFCMERSYRNFISGRVIVPFFNPNRFPSAFVRSFILYHESWVTGPTGTFLLPSFSPPPPQTLPYSPDPLQPFSPSLEFNDPINRIPRPVSHEARPLWGTRREINAKKMSEFLSGRAFVWAMRCCGYR